MCLITMPNNRVLPKSVSYCTTEVPVLTSTNSYVIPVYKEATEVTLFALQY